MGLPGGPQDQAGAQPQGRGVLPHGSHKAWSPRTSTEAVQRGGGCAVSHVPQPAGALGWGVPDVTPPSPSGDAAPFRPPDLPLPRVRAAPQRERRLGPGAEAPGRPPGAVGLVVQAVEGGWAARPGPREQLARAPQPRPSHPQGLLHCVPAPSGPGGPRGGCSQGSGGHSPACLCWALRRAGQEPAGHTGRALPFLTGSRGPVTRRASRWPSALRPPRTWRWCGPCWTTWAAPASCPQTAR